MKRPKTEDRGHHDRYRPFEIPNRLGWAWPYVFIDHKGRLDRSSAREWARLAAKAMWGKTSLFASVPRGHFQGYAWYAAGLSGSGWILVVRKGKFHRSLEALAVDGYPVWGETHPLACWAVLAIADGDEKARSLGLTVPEVARCQNKPPSPVPPPTPSQASHQDEAKLALYDSAEKLARKILRGGMARRQELLACGVILAQRMGCLWPGKILRAAEQAVRGEESPEALQSLGDVSGFKEYKRIVEAELGRIAKEVLPTKKQVSAAWDRARLDAVEHTEYEKTARLKLDVMPYIYRWAKCAYWPKLPGVILAAVRLVSWHEKDVVEVSQDKETIWRFTHPAKNRWDYPSYMDAMWRRLPGCFEMGKRR